MSSAMTAQELVDDLAENVENGHYFEINPKDGKTLLEYIYMLQRRPVPGPEAGTLYMCGED